MHTNLFFTLSIVIESLYLVPHIGRYLYEVLVTEYKDNYEVVFVWNRSPEKMNDIVPHHLVLSDLSEAASRSPDLIVEVAHPSIVAEYGTLFLQIADFMVHTLLHRLKYMIVLMFYVIFVVGYWKLA